jgi:hypothetical protein
MPKESTEFVYVLRWSTMKGEQMLVFKTLDLAESELRKIIKLGVDDAYVIPQAVYKRNLFD